MQFADGAMVGAAGTAVVGGLIWKLIEKGILTKQDAIDIYLPIIKAKESKAQIDGLVRGETNSAEFDIQDVLVAMLSALDKKFPDPQS